MPQFECVNELVPKLMQGFTSVEATTTIMNFDNNQYLKGIENLGFLHNAIFYKKVLSIKYQPFENDLPFELIHHPYYLNNTIIDGFFSDSIQKIKSPTGILHWTGSFPWKK